MMWYLFITTRKASLLNEFLTNLDRLGLLDPREDAGGASPESAASHQRRLYTYLQKFAAVYGPVPTPSAPTSWPASSIPRRQPRPTPRRC